MTVNWTEFEKIPGGAQHNFEVLCRGLIQLHYGRFGKLGGLANQPGVEFHLHLNTTCSLGLAGRWFGWQCRWYGLPTGVALGTARRKKIEDALDKTKKALPDLTDWILWTRHPLTKGDQDWFNKLKTTMQLHLWTSANAETLLAGDAEMLRRTYFGELVLSPTTLAQIHETAVAPIKRRWLPDVHQQVDAERTIRRMLGQPDSWNEVTALCVQLRTAAKTITKLSSTVPAELKASLEQFLRRVDDYRVLLENVHASLHAGDYDSLWRLLAQRPEANHKETAGLLRKLRGSRLNCSLYVTNASSDMRTADRLLSAINAALGKRFLAVLADAGGGKSQLAAQLTAALPTRPAGILLHGRELQAGKTLDDLANQVVIHGNPVPSIEGLVAALDAAGQRSRCRLPLVIDGLNEAEDPRDWKSPLASLTTLLQRFPSVLVVCTLRTGARRPVEYYGYRRGAGETEARSTFADDALPDDTERIEIPDFGTDVISAIKKYFQYFRINPGDAELPIELLSHPLTLRIFCEVANADRKKDVGLEAIPTSLTGLFERYIERAIERIGELAPKHQRYYPQDIRAVLDVIGLRFWDTNQRELSEKDLRSEIGDSSRPWNESIVHMLEQEGVILRIPSGTPGDQLVIPVYDALGGYLTANALLTKYGRDNFIPWIKAQSTQAALNGNDPNCHPLASDIFSALAGLLPRRQNRQQLWQLLDEPLRRSALLTVTRLEAVYLDAASITAIEDSLLQATSGADAFLFFRRLFNSRATVAHPLNAEFLDGVLRRMSVSQRDLSWTEWIRKNRDTLQKNVEQWRQRWEADVSSRSPADSLRAKWIMWLLTTTAHDLRDKATRALYWFGRGEPRSLFAATEGASDINDPYVFERVLAASYGVALAIPSRRDQQELQKKVVAQYARRVFDLMFAEEAPGSTTHLLTREYGSRLIEFAAHQNRRSFSTKELARTRPPFVNGSRIVWQVEKTDENEVHRLSSPFRMDFENYTLGRLVEDRNNYDYKHEGYRRIRAQALWRVHDLGWSTQKFGEIDRSIDSDDGRRFGRESDDPHKIDRYGKKYSWIAYFELAGWLQDQGTLKDRADENRTWDVDIDPTFPTVTPEYGLVTTDFLGDPKQPLYKWIEKGPTPDLTPYFQQPTILGESGPWLMLDGLVSQHDESRGRKLSAYIRSFLVARSLAPALVEALKKQDPGGRWLPEKAESHYVFAGEIPWCSTFVDGGNRHLEVVIKERKTRVRKREPVYYHDGTEISLPELWLQFGGLARRAPELKNDDADQKIVRKYRIVEVEQVQQETRKFRTIVPVQDLNLAGNKLDGVSTHGITLAKVLAKEARLIQLPQTYDLQTMTGVRATYGVAFHPQSYKNSQRFLFIREEVLRSLIRKHGFSLVWVVWGQRELSYKQVERVNFDGAQLPGPAYCFFQSIHRMANR